MNKLLTKVLTIQPILFGIFFIILRYNDNADELVASDLLFVLSIAIPATIVLTVVSRLIIKDLIKSLLVSSFLITIFFVYMPLRHILLQSQIGQSGIAQNVILFPIFVICSLVIIIFFVKSKKNYGKLLEISFVIIVSLILFNVIEITFYSNVYSYSPSDDLIQSFTVDKNGYRNVYHIILDEHASTSSLKRYLDYDNSDFDRSLEELGFFIPVKSYSNYKTTTISIPSLLNMNYIHADLPSNEKERDAIMKSLTNNNIVTKMFEKNGYQTISFYNEFNLRTTNSSNQLCNNNAGNLLFLSFILDNTPIAIVKGFGDPGNYKGYAENRLCIFETLSNTNELESYPKYVFAHIMLPHEPFIFDADGNLNPYEKQKPADKVRAQYLDQLEFTDSKTLQLVKKLLAEDPQPIIIIQSDHGRRVEDNTKEGFEQSFSNFAAFYIPEAKFEDFPQVFSLVNTYRIIFNYNFGTNYELLENRMYVIDDKGKVEDVTTFLISPHSSNSTN